MKSILSSSFSLYIQDFLKLILLSVLTYVPLLFLHAIIVNYIYAETRFAEYPGLIGDVANGIFMIVFLTIAQLPFIKYTLLESEDADHPLKQAISFAIEKALPIYFFACLYSVCIFIGGLLYVIPGLVVLVLFYFVPFFLAENGKLRTALKKSIGLIKAHFIKAIFVIFILSIIQLVFENIMIYLLSLYTDVYFTTLALKIVLLMFLLPLQVIILTNIFNSWRDTEKGGI